MTAGAYITCFSIALRKAFSAPINSLLSEMNIKLSCNCNFKLQNGNKTSDRKKSNDKNKSCCQDIFCSKTSIIYTVAGTLEQAIGMLYCNWYSIRLKYIIEVTSQNRWQTYAQTITNHQYFKSY